MKKIIPLSLAIIFVLTMVGCTQAPNYTILHTHNTTEEIYNETTEITVEADTNITENIDKPIETKDNALQTDESAGNENSDTIKENEDNSADTPVYESNIKTFKDIKTFTETLSAASAKEGQDQEQIRKQGYIETEIGKVPLEFRELKGLDPSFGITMIEWSFKDSWYTIYYGYENQRYAFTPETDEQKFVENMNYRLKTYSLNYEGLVARGYTNIRKNNLPTDLGVKYEYLYGAPDNEMRLVYHEYSDEKTGCEYHLIEKHRGGELRYIDLFVIDGERSFDIMTRNVTEFTMEDAIKLRSAVIE